MGAFVASHKFVVLLDDETDAPIVWGIKELHRPFAMDEGSILCSKGRVGGHLRDLREMLGSEVEVPVVATDLVIPQFESKGQQVCSDLDLRSLPDCVCVVLWCE